MKDEYWIRPLQPFVEKSKTNYIQLEKPYLGISHYYEMDMKSGTSHILEAVPDGSIDLLFNIGEKKVHTYISGTVFRAKEWDFGENEKCFGVRFQPGEGVLPKELSMEMLVDSDLEIEASLFGEHLSERIALAGGIEERSRIFEEAYQQFFREHRKDGTKEHLSAYISKRIVQTQGKITISELAGETQYSPCYIRRVFKELHGVSPKQQAKYIRFQHVLREMGSRENDFVQIAMHCGYYDEAHMIREFKNYTQYTPEKYSRLLFGKGR